MPFNSPIIQDLQQTEYRLQIYLDWLKSVKLENSKKNEFIQKQISLFLNDVAHLYQQIPDHEILHSIHKVTSKLPSTLLSDEQKNKIPDVNNSHWILENSAKANKLRIDTNVSLGLVRHFLQLSSLNSTDIFLLDTTSYTLTSLGIAIPFFNLFLITYEFFCKLRQDLKNESKTKKHNWYLYLKQYQILKNLLLILLNTTNFMVSYFNLFPVHFYFSFASITLDHIFYAIDYVKHDEFLVKQEQNFIHALLDKDSSFKSPTSKKKKDFHHELIEKYSQSVNEELKFLILQILVTHQKQKMNKDKFIFECISFILMLSTMIVMQTTGILPAQQLHLIGLLSSYFYNVLKSYLVNIFIDLKNMQKISLLGPNQEKISLRQGNICKTESLPKNQIPAHIILPLLAKIAVPIIIINVLPALLPLEIVLLLSGSHLLINLLEELFKPKKPTEKLDTETKFETDPTLNVKPKTA